MCGFGFEASVDDDQCGGEQHPADQQRPLADESPPLAEVSTDDQRAEDTQRGEYDDAEDMRAPDFCRRDLDATGEANTDAEEDRRQDIDQAANDQAHAETRCCCVENTPRGYSRGTPRLWTGGPGAEPARCTRRWERSRGRASSGVNSNGLVGWWIGSARCRVPGFLTGSSPNLARWRSPVHGAPG